MLASLARNWWVVLFRGICAVLFGIVAFACPGITLASLVIVYGVYAIIDGWSAIAIGLSDDADGVPWWQMILVGVLSIVAGVLTFQWPGITAVALLAVIAAWSIVRGIVEIVAAIRLRTVIDNEWLLILSGACSIAFGAILVVRPGAGALAVVWIIGSYAIVFGLLTTALAFKLRSLNTDVTYAASVLTPAAN
jgi:uncharacterized membrane protein HdeD (DUF308 family)